VGNTWNNGGFAFKLDSADLPVIKLSIREAGAEADSSVIHEPDVGAPITVGIP
jgi:hypothetical protein